MTRSSCFRFGAGRSGGPGPASPALARGFSRSSCRVRFSFRGSAVVPWPAAAAACAGGAGAEAGAGGGVPGGERRVELADAIPLLGDETEVDRPPAALEDRLEDAVVAVGVGAVDALAVQAADAGAEPHADHAEGGEVEYPQRICAATLSSIDLRGPLHARDFSPRCVAKTRAQLEAWQSQPLDGLDLVGSIPRRRACR